MLTDDDYDRILDAYQRGMSIRAIARTFHHGRQTVREVIDNPKPKTYRRRRAYRPKLTDAFQRRIDALLLDEQSAGRHSSAAEIYRVLSAAGYRGGYDQVRRYVSSKRQESRDIHPRKPR